MNRGMIQKMRVNANVNVDSTRPIAGGNNDVSAASFQHRELLMLSGLTLDIQGSASKVVADGCARKYRATIRRADA